MEIIRSVLSLLFAGSFVFLALSCTTASKPALQEATSDFSCAPESITLTEKSKSLSGRTEYHASGCDKQADYLCMNRLFGTPVCRIQSDIVAVSPDSKKSF